MLVGELGKTFKTLILRRKITAKNNDTSILTKFSKGVIQANQRQKLNLP
jgi:hypothetical protein